MKCENIEELLSPYLEDELSLEEKTRIENHLKTCQDCTALLSMLKETKDSLASLPELEVSPNLLNRLYAIPEEKKKYRLSFDFLLRPSLQPVLALASVFFIILSFYMFHPDRNYINKSIDRQIHLGYSQVQKLYVKAGSFKDNFTLYKDSIVQSFNKIKPWGKSED
ncbi:MAG: anti-sigma factor [Candidatus Aminicenantaceae bacterium]